MGLGKTYSTKYLLDSNNSSGVAGQVLSTTSTGIDWVDANTVPGTGLWLASGNNIYNSNSGNVGIGVTTPTSSVHVNGLQANVTSTSAHVPTGTMRLNFAGASSAHEYGASLVFTQRWWTGSTGEVAMGQITGVKETGDGNYGGGLAFFTSNNTGNNLLERLRINELGNVGIGTDSPNYKLEVNGTLGVNRTDGIIFAGSAGAGYGNKITANASNDLIFSTSLPSAPYTVSEKMRILNSGNVGIGVTNPPSKLTIETEAGDGTIELLAVNAATTKNKIIFSEAVLGDESFFIEHDGAGAGADNLLKIHGDGSGGTASGITIRRDGRVGILENAPAVPLHVSSDSASGENIALLLDNNDQTAGSEIGILFRCMTGGANTDFEIYGKANAANEMDLVFESDGSVERMRLKNDGDLQIARYLEHLGDTNSYLGWSGGDDFRIYTGGRELLRLDEGTDPDVLNFMSTNFSMSTGGELKLLNNGGSKIIFSGNGANPTSTEASIYDQSGVGLTLSAHNVSIRNYDGTNMIESARFVHDKLTCAGDVIGYGSPSDVRLKENIKPIKSALDKVSKLQGVTFDWKKSDSILDIKEDIGFIAQDVQEVLPELVRENSDGMLSMRHQGITPILLEAIKELKAEIEDLKKKIK